LGLSHICEFGVGPKWHLAYRTNFAAISTCDVKRN
jgi:hypothetical protein